MELVSAVITTYKRDVKTLERALLSVINQTYNNIEIIIVNDYPEIRENNIAIGNMIDEYSSKHSIKYHVVKKNGGACVARNIGLKMAKGKYIGFLDDDDEWKTNKVERMIEIFKSNPAVKMVYSNADLYYVEKNIIQNMNNKKMPSGFIYDKLLYRNFIGSCSFPIFVKAELDAINGYNEKMPASQDWELYLRFSKNNKIYYINENLTKFYIHEGDRISKNIEKRKLGLKLVYEEFKKEFDKNKDLKQSYYFNLINIELDEMNYDEAYRSLKVAIKINPFSILKNVKQLIKIKVRKALRIRKV